MKQESKIGKIGKRFQRKIEDFTCNNCSFEVSGNGFTNHCPKCLWSRHVDKNPGDRAEMCCGMMEPSKIEKKGDNYTILHKCVKCGFVRKNKMDKVDDFSVAVQISKGSR